MVNEQEKALVTRAFTGCLSDQEDENVISFFVDEENGNRDIVVMDFSSRRKFDKDKRSIIIPFDGTFDGLLRSSLESIQGIDFFKMTEEEKSRRDFVFAFMDSLKAEKVREEVAKDPFLKKVDIRANASVYSELKPYFNAREGERFVFSISHGETSYENEPKRYYLKLFSLDRFEDKERMERYFCKGESTKQVREWGYHLDENYLAVKGSGRVNKIGRVSALNLAEDMYLDALVSMPVGKAFELESKDSYVSVNDVVSDRVVFIKDENSEFHQFTNALFRKDGKPLTKNDDMIYQGTVYLYNTLYKDVMPQFAGKLRYGERFGDDSFSKEDLKLITDNLKKGQVVHMGDKIDLMRSVTRHKKITKMKKKTKMNERGSEWEHEDNVRGAR